MYKRGRVSQVQMTSVVETRVQSEIRFRFRFRCGAKSDFYQKLFFAENISANHSLG